MNDLRLIAEHSRPATCDPGHTPGDATAKAIDTLAEWGHASFAYPSPERSKTMGGIENKPLTGSSISRRTTPQTDEASGRTTPVRRNGAALDTTETSPREYSSTPTARAGEIPQTASEGGAGSGSEVGEATLEKAFKQMEDLEAQINDLDPEKPGDQKKLMLIQLKLQRIQQVISLINEIRKARHNMAMAVINNIN
jgi:hypothetical protein